MEPLVYLSVRANMHPHVIYKEYDNIDQLSNLSIQNRIIAMLAIRSFYSFHNYLCER